MTFLFFSILDTNSSISTAFWLERFARLTLLFYLIYLLRLADERKEEGNQLYKLKNYRDALQKYSEAIGKIIV